LKIVLDQNIKDMLKVTHSRLPMPFFPLWPLLPENLNPHQPQVEMVDKPLKASKRWKFGKNRSDGFRDFEGRRKNL